MATRIKSKIPPRKTKAEYQFELHKILCRLAILRDDALRCEVSACRRARICMGERLLCVYKPHDPARPVTVDYQREWNELARQRRALLDVLKRY